MDPDGKILIPMSNPLVVEPIMNFLKGAVAYITTLIVADTIADRLDEPKERVAHYTSYENLAEIEKKWVLKPGQGEEYVYAMEEPSTLEQALNAGAGAKTPLEVKISFDKPPSWVKDKGTDVPGAVKSLVPDPQPIGHLNPKVEPVVEQTMGLFERITNWFGTIFK